MPLNLTKINCITNIKNPLKSRIYEQIAKYLTADNSVVHNSNANDIFEFFRGDCVRFVFKLSPFWKPGIGY